MLGQLNRSDIVPTYTNGHTLISGACRMMGTSIRCRTNSAGSRYSGVRRNRARFGSARMRISPCRRSCRPCGKASLSQRADKPWWVNATPKGVSIRVQLHAEQYKKLKEFRIKYRFPAVAVLRELLELFGRCGPEGQAMMTAEKPVKIWTKDEE